MNSSHVVASNLGVTFTSEQQQTTAFSEVSVTIPQGQFCAILGPSGCGKTTLLRAVGGLLASSEGSLEINGDDEHRSGMVFQQNDLFPWMSLKRNITFFLENNPKIPAHEVDKIATHFLDKAGLTAFSNYFPGDVSGGMQQRTSIVRAFANDADLLLMDEPFVFLDYQSRIQLHQVLLDIWEERRKTVLFVTHDIDEAVFLADRILVMSAHPGTITQDIKINFPRPRSVTDLRKNQRYIEIVDTLTQSIINASV